MQAGVSLLVTDVMPIYMIIPRYSHNYLLLYQLPNSNLFTHCMLFSREKPLLKTMAPGSTFYHILKPKVPCCVFTLFILFCIFVRSIYLAITIQFNLATNRQGIDNPLFALGARICYLCVGTANEVLRGSPTGLITFVLNRGKYLSLLYCIILSSSRHHQHLSSTFA